MKLAKRMFAISLLVTLSLSMVACAEVNVLGVSTPTTPLAVSDGSTVSDFETPVAYRNDYFGYQCVLPDDWYVLNREEINQALGITSEALGEGEAADIIMNSFESGATYIDFYALSGDNSQTINIILEKAKPLILVASEEDIIDSSTPLMLSGLMDMGVTNIEHNTEKVEFLGKERIALHVQGDYQGVSVFQTMFVIVEGRYISNIAVNGNSQDAMQECLQYFQPIE